MTISLASHQRTTARATEAVEFLADPLRRARERGYDDLYGGYPYALGEAKAIIESLLDCVGWCQAELERRQDAADWRAALKAGAE